MLNASLKELSAALAQRKISSVELTRLFLERVEKLNGSLNAFITVDAEKSLAQARAADERIAKGATQPLTGIPVAHKDIFVTRSWLTTCGSRILSNFVSPYDAHVIERFNGAGAVILGKTNMDEFAMGSSSETSFYGPVKNPWGQAYVPGGSSGGSAAAVAARMAPAATGTDTGGSIRQPAALSGVSGLKPTYGLVSRYGMIAFASSLDQGGPLAKSAEDLALLLNVMAGFDARDSTSVERAREDYVRNLEKPLAGLRYGHRAKKYHDLADMYRRTRAEGFGPEVRRRILIGTYVLSHGYYDAYYLKAQKIRRLIADDFAAAFKQCDVIVGPTAPTVAFKIGVKAADPVQMYLNDIYTIPVDLAGLPGMSIPCGFGKDDLPVGLHIVGNYFSEAKMLNVAHQYQKATDWHKREPTGIQR